MSILPPKRLSDRTGLNILDLGNASREQKTLVKIILKRINATEAELWSDVQSLPENKRMERAAFEQALQELVNAKWLWKTGQGESACYSTRMQKKVNRVQLRVQMSASPNAAFNAMWDLLEQRAVLEERNAVTSAQPTRPAVTARLADWIANLSGVQQVMALLVFISAASSFSASTLEITGVSGFVATVGTQNLPWLSIVEMLLGLLTSAVYIQFADRLPRVRLMKWMLAGLAATYLLVAGLFLASAARSNSQAWLYPLVYLLRSQQIILFPIAFWNLANSLYSMTEARQVFPILASGGTVGGLLGYTLFTKLVNGQALFTGADAPLLLALNAGFFLLSLVFTQGMLKEKFDEADGEKPEGQNILASLRAGLENIHNVMLFRYLALVVMLVRVAFCLFIYHNITTLNAAGGFSNLYSLFGIASAVLPLILQWRVTPLFSSKVATKDAFIVLPVTLALSISVISFLPGILPVTLGLLISGSVSSSWDYPMFNTLQNLIPEERRAQISTLLNNYSFAVGQISGSLLLVGVLTLAPVLGLPEKWIYLPVAFLAALGAVAAAWMVRRTYTDSMLSWRIARRQRSASVLDKLDF